MTVMSLLQLFGLYLLIGLVIIICKVRKYGVFRVNDVPEALVFVVCWPVRIGSLVIDSIVGFIERGDIVLWQRKERSQ